MAENKSFFATLPGILTGLAALVTAIGGLLFTLDETGVLDVLRKEPKVVQQGGENPGRDKKGIQGTEGWAIIGKAKDGRFFDLKIMVHGRAPAIGQRYDVADGFRLVAKPPHETPDKAQIITLGKVQRGDKVEVLDLYVETPSSKRVPVYAKLRAKLN